MKEEEKLTSLQIELNGLLVEECHLRAKQKELKEKRALLEQKVLHYGFILNGKTIKKTNQLNILDEIEKYNS